MFLQEVNLKWSYSSREVEQYCNTEDCLWTDIWHCNWSPQNPKVGQDSSLGVYACCILRTKEKEPCGGPRVGMFPIYPIFYEKYSVSVAKKSLGEIQKGAPCYTPFDSFGKKNVATFSKQSFTGKAEKFGSIFKT